MRRYVFKWLEDPAWVEPVNNPPRREILAYANLGIDETHNVPILTAIVMAETAEAAEEMLRLEWPSAGKNQWDPPPRKWWYEHGPYPVSRSYDASFPLADWMRERLKNAA